jgi:hypothetical protein
VSGDVVDDERGPTAGERGANPRRPTQAQSIKRQQEIVADHDGVGMSFAEIARKHRMGEKEVREAYRRYIEEIAPLMTASAPAAKVGLYLRELALRPEPDRLPGQMKTAGVGDGLAMEMPDGDTVQRVVVDGLDLVVGNRVVHERESLQARTPHRVEWLERGSETPRYREGGLREG